MRLGLGVIIAALLMVACGGSSDREAAPDRPETPADPAPTSTPGTGSADRGTNPSDKGPGGYGFDRSDPEQGIANIMEAFATDRATAACIHDAWGDVANVAPAELTPELMTFEICGTSIFEMMSGDPRFTGAGEP